MKIKGGWSGRVCAKERSNPRTQSAVLDTLNGIKHSGMKLPALDAAPAYLASKNSEMKTAAILLIKYELVK